MSKKLLRSTECLVMAIVMIAAVVCADVLPVCADELISQDTLMQELSENDDSVEVLNDFSSREEVYNEDLISADSLFEDESYEDDEADIPDAIFEPDYTDNNGDDFAEEPDTANGTSKDDPLSIQIGTDYQDTLTDKIGAKYYKFSISEAGKLSFSFKHDRIDRTSNVWFVSLYNSNNYSDNAFIESVDYVGNETQEVTNGTVGVPAGTYYLKIGDNWGYSRGYKYNFRVNYEASPYWEKENDSATNQTLINTDTWMNGCLQENSDYDYYRFEIPGDGKISFSFKHDRIDRSSDVWYLSLYNSDSYADKNIVETVKFVGNETQEVTCGIVGLPAGVYYILIGDNWDYSVEYEYRFKVNYEPSLYWEKEIDSATNQTLIDTNTWINGSLQSNGDHDYYKFDMPGDGKISFSFKHDRINRSSDVWFLALYDSDSYADKDLVESLDFVGDETKETEAGTISISKGTYYIKIGDYWDYSIGMQYSFKVNSPFNTSTNLTVTFKSDDKVYATQTVKKDECATKPKDPVKQGYTFDGWYDRTYTNKFDFSTKITANTTLYAKWTRISGSIYTNELTLVAGRKVTLKEDCFPGLTTAVSRYIINNKKLASQSKDKLKIKKPGTVEITAQASANGSYEDIGVCTITILSKPKLKFTVPMTYQGQTMNASDFFTTTDTNPSQVTLWESSKPDVIRVANEKSGTLEAVDNGSAKITAYFGQKGATGTVKVSATLKVKVPKFAKAEYKIKTGAKKTLSMKNVVAAQNPQFSIDNTSFATVEAQLNKKGDPTGKVIVRGVSAGDTILKAVVDGKEYTCTIHITGSK